MPLPLSTQTWQKEEVDAAIEVIRSGNTTMGKHVEEFEQQFAEYFGSKYALMSNSGSSANLLAVAAISYAKFEGNPKGKEVIVPAISWSTTYYPLAQLGFKLRFVDVDIDTLNLDIKKTVQAVNGNTVGIFAVNLLGQPADLDELRKIADTKGLFFIEDNCESMGATLNGKHAGTFGDIGTFSSFFSHHINTMEGGMSITDDLKLYQYMYSLRAHGWTRGLPDKNFVHDKSGNHWDDHFRFVLPGYNLRPLEVSAAIGKIQLKRLKGFIDARRANAVFLKETLGRNENVLIQSGRGESSAFAFSLILKNNLHGKRDLVLNELAKYGIETRPVVTGNFVKQPVNIFLNSEFEELNNAELVDANGFYIGNHHYDVKEALKEVSGILERLVN